MASNNIMKALGLAGAAFAAWWFLDPKNGAQRRDRAAKSARDVYDNLGKEITRIGDELATGVTDVVNRVGSMARGATEEAETASTGKKNGRRSVHVD